MFKDEDESFDIAGHIIFLSLHCSHLRQSNIRVNNAQIQLVFPEYQGQIQHY